VYGSEEDLARSYAFTIMVGGSPERIWRALTDERESAEWYFRTGVSSTWKPQAGLLVSSTGGRAAIQRGVMRVEEYRSLTPTFQALWDEEVASDPLSEVKWHVEKRGDSCRVSICHETRLGPCFEAELAECRVD
jgi:uncharacterized protein YndB with AHSA1/START domain